MDEKGVRTIASESCDGKEKLLQDLVVRLIVATNENWNLVWYTDQMLVRNVIYLEDERESYVNKLVKY